MTLRWLFRWFHRGNLNALTQSFKQTATQLNSAPQTSVAELDDILNSVSSSIVRFRVFLDKSWEYDYQSPGCELLFGYTADEICADRSLWMSQVFAADRETILYPLFDQIFNCQTQTIEFRFQHKDGSLRWISATYSSRYDAVDNCWIVTGVSNDITDRKHAEAALAQEILRRRTLFDISIDGIFVIDQAGNVVEANTSFANMLGYSLEEIITLNLTDFDAY